MRWLAGIRGDITALPQFAGYRALFRWSCGAGRCSGIRTQAQRCVRRVLTAEPPGNWRIAWCIDTPNGSEPGFPVRQKDHKEMPFGRVTEDGRPGGVDSTAILNGNASADPAAGVSVDDGGGKRSTGKIGNRERGCGKRRMRVWERKAADQQQGGQGKGLSWRTERGRHLVEFR
jgi:hypothetical protein